MPSEMACQLGLSERTVRCRFERGVAPDTRPRRKQQSDFDRYAPYVLTCWQDGERNGTRLCEEIAGAAVCLFMRHPDTLDEGERMDRAALRRVHPDLETAYCLTRDFLQMLRKREGKRLDAWLACVHESGLPEPAGFAHGVELDKAAVQAGW